MMWMILQAKGRELQLPGITTTVRDFVKMTFAFGYRISFRGKALKKRLYFKM